MEVKAGSLYEAAVFGLEVLSAGRTNGQPAKCRHRPGGDVHPPPAAHRVRVQQLKRMAQRKPKKPPRGPAEAATEGGG